MPKLLIISESLSSQNFGKEITEPTNENYEILTNLNRDVTKTQEITKDQITGALDITTTIDNRIFSEKGREQMAQEQKDLGKNLLITHIALSDLAAEVPGSPVWASRLIDENNNEVDKKTGELVDHPAPNLWTGNPLDPLDEPSVGRNDLGCKAGAFCKNTISDEAYHLQALYYGIPSFKSFSQFHDAATTNADGSEKSGAYKFISIFPYLPANYYGAIGTILDAKNWTQNSPQNSNNSNSVFSHDKQSE